LKAEYRSRLFGSYDRHLVGLDPPDQEKLRWFRAYYAAHYAPQLAGVDRASGVLEIGCSKGFLLQVLDGDGFAPLSGIDWSPEDLKRARALAPKAKLAHGDAALILGRDKTRYGVILLKAVLEHVPKKDVLPLLRLLASRLKPGGRLLVDVPNMDWLGANHERYMDFTHEGGFTRESLRQVLGESFEVLEVFTADNHVTGGLWGNLRRRLAQGVLGSLLGWADPEIGANPVWERSLIGVATPKARR